ncbi:hypothetical protein QMM44_13315 [Leptospira santarosai]|uniref:Uncharacterized protein n=1 Tax=Leptospira santarosai serovar Shermani str. LT 821 TaxID=758847 RepID=K8Y7G4_9LEPT|nr:hypothetical protein [Leptospira santarosai]EKT85710.1 hypothetical protein LSS_16301 [Leptospira santarosai serovar Shermani str. LT 821]EPG80522.1 hypothetical protein LEP1GSC048_0040 [Leptospira santarosai serovar Shermani str. 1342KT]MDI7204407.1 hypothetical protein [Leptospira santarosai]
MFFHEHRSFLKTLCICPILKLYQNHDLENTEHVKKPNVRLRKIRFPKILTSERKTTLRLYRILFR